MQLIKALVLYPHMMHHSFTNMVLVEELQWSDHLGMALRKYHHV